MKHSFWMPVMRLTLFDGGAEGAAAPAGAADGAGAAAGTQAGTQASSGRSRRGKTGGSETVVYGKQADPAAAAAATTNSSDAGSAQKAETSAAATEDKKSKFLELVGGEYKDQYTQEVDRIINRRFKETKTLQESLSAQQPVLDLLMEKYKVTDGDIAKLRTAIEQDDTYWADAAEAAGMTTDQYREFRKLQRENEQFRAASQQRSDREAAQQQYAKWMQDAETVKASYANFDLTSEVQNPQFLSLLRSGVPMQHAYEVMHLDAIKGTVAQQTAKQTEKKVVDGIRAKGARPAENGVSSQSGITIKSDVTKLSKTDRAEIARRAARGEQISF